MTVYERIKHYRKNVLNLTQEEFAKRINVSRANIASIERGRITVTDRVVSDICNAFSVSEEWLRNGTGEIHQDTETTLFSAFAKQYDLSEAEQNVAKYLLAIPSAERQKLMEHIVGLAGAITTAQEISNKKTPAELDAETAAFRQELEKMEQYKTKMDDTHSAV